MIRVFFIVLETLVIVFVRFKSILGKARFRNLLCGMRGVLGNGDDVRGVLGNVSGLFGNGAFLEKMFLGIEDGGEEDGFMN